MKKLLFSVFILLLFSCNNKKTSQQVIEIQVDTLESYPVYYECKAEKTPQDQMSCLTNNLSFFYAYHLSKTFHNKIKNRQDTVKLQLELDTLGYLGLNSITHTNKENLQRIDSVFQAITKMVPKIEPARAQGKKVFFKFNLPVILKN